MNGVCSEPSHRVLIIGCERHVGRLIQVNLERQGHACSFAPTKESICESAMGVLPTLAVLDDSRMSAADTLEELIKAGFGNIPILRLSGMKGDPPFWFTRSGK